MSIPTRFEDLSVLVSGIYSKLTSVGAQAAAHRESASRRPWTKAPEAWICVPCHLFRRALMRCARSRSARHRIKKDIAREDAVQLGSVEHCGRSEVWASRESDLPPF